VTRRLVILGTAVTLPDPASVADLAAGFRGQGGELADLEATLQALTRPDAWGAWTGEAADAFGQSLGQLPAEIGDVRDAYDEVALVLQRYAAELEPVINALTSLSFQAEDAEGTLAAVRTARSQAMARGENSAATGWDARLADATAAVSSLRSQLNRLLGELTALAATCTKQITAAEPRKAKKSLFGSLESDFVKDVADPLGRAFETAGRLGLLAAGEELALGALGSIDVIDAFLVHPITDLYHDGDKLLHGLTAEKLGQVLGDVAGVLGILAFIPGVDVFAVPALVVVSAAAAAADWWAVAKHEKGASVLDASLATVSFALGGVSFVAGRAVSADAGMFQAADKAGDLDELEDLKNGADARVSGAALWKAGLPRSFTTQDVKAAVQDSLEESHNPVKQILGIDDDGFTHSPAAVRIEHIKNWADRGSTGVTLYQDARNHEEAQVS
jgi:uncharacterized protein YukE